MDPINFGVIGPAFLISFLHFTTGVNAKPSTDIGA